MQNKFRLSQTNFLSSADDYANGLLVLSSAAIQDILIIILVLISKKFQENHKFINPNSLTVETQR